VQTVHSIPAARESSKEALPPNSDPTPVALSEPAAAGACPRNAFANRFDIRRGQAAMDCEDLRQNNGLRKTQHRHWPFLQHGVDGNCNARANSLAFVRAWASVKALPERPRKGDDLLLGGEMKIQGQKLVIALTRALGMGAVFLVIGAPAMAQDIKVEVTGSSIRRVEGEGALPVQTIGRTEILQSGATNAMDVLTLISANNSSGSGNLSSTSGQISFGNQTASLRGLGAQYTLVLVNGKRLGTFAGGVSGFEGVNLAAIPLAAIDRVEVLTDGASAIYGSDAVAGVINFIMRNNFTGVDATAQYGMPTRSGGGEQWILQGAVGAGDLTKDKYNAFLSVQYQSNKALNDVDRNFARSSYIPAGGLNTTSGQTFPAFVYDPATGDGVGQPGFPNCAPSIVVGSRCRFDPAAYPGVNAIPESSQLNLFGSAQYQFNADWKGYLTGLYSKAKSTTTIQPIPVSDQISALSMPSGNSEIIIQPKSPFYPHDVAAAAGVDGQPLGIRLRCTLCGNRSWDDDTDAWQIVAGIKGTAWSWDWDGSFNYSANKLKEQGKTGMHLNTLFVPLMNTIVNTTFNPFGPSLPGAKEAIDATLYTGVVQNSKLDGYGIDFKGSGEIYRLPAGPLALAVGLQAGKTTLNQKFDPDLLDVDHYGAAFYDIDQSRTVWGVFGEINVPIFSGFEAIGQLRFDHYSDFGNTTNPKVALRWQVAKSLLLRGSYGTGFAAPTLYQLWTPQSPGLSPTGQTDPLRCPVQNENNPDCNTQYNATFGGNQNLEPAKSKTWQVGGIWEPGGLWAPLNGLSISADYLWLDLKNLVGNGIPYSTILDPALYSTYANLVTRAATCQPSAFVPGAPCAITAIDQRFVNQGEIKIQAIDVSIKYNVPMKEYGQFVLGLEGTYYVKWNYQNPDGTFSGYVSNAYQNPFSTGGGFIPRWKWYAPINWTYGPWSATLANNYQSSYVDVNTLDDEGLITRRVGSLSTWDLQAVYSGFKDLKLTLGAKNLFDKNPPFTNSNLNFQAGYDVLSYDARARFVYGSVNYAFK